MAALRIISFAVFLILLVKPVLNLTVNEPVRQSLLVLVDSSQSMQLVDRRTTPEDLKRAEMATGEAGSGEHAITRWALLQKLSANPRLNLWPRSPGEGDVVFYRFGRDATLVGPLSTTPEATATSAPIYWITSPPTKPPQASGNPSDRSSTRIVDRPSAGSCS